ncbi:MAG: acyloxyacyl hydrolase [Thermodesulfovibrionales bacterium]
MGKNPLTMKRKNICISVLALGIVAGFLMLSAEASDSGYEIAGGAGTGLNNLGSAENEGILLGAWITPLSAILDLRVEPNMEIIVPRSGKSLFLGGVNPVLRVSSHGQSLNPFLDAGVGVSIGSRETLLNRNFGSNFFFSPTAGAGVKFGRSAGGVSLFMRWLHHSNAGLFKPNEGIDSLYVLLGYRF